MSSEVQRTSVIRINNPKFGFRPQNIYVLFIKVVWESQLQDAKPICGLACLVSQCVCGIPYYTSANFPDFLSAHTDIPIC